MTTSEPNEQSPGDAVDRLIESAVGDAAGGDAVSRLERERDEMRDLALRARADYDNLKRRTDEERGRLARSAADDVIASLLPSVDDLERAVAALPEDAPAGWSEGVRLVLRNLQGLLAAAGVARIDPAPGDAFDPREHDGVYHQPTRAQPPGRVVGTYRAGYRSPGRVLRPAQVVVASAPEGDAGGDASSGDAAAGEGEPGASPRPPLAFRLRLRRRPLRRRPTLLWNPRFIRMRRS